MSGENRRRTLAVIAARGGSKGIPHKNLIDLCGKPLIAWTVLQAGAARGVDVVAVSSDSDAILAAAEAAGAVGVRRPDDISGDLASSEAAWLHALEHVDGKLGPFERIVALAGDLPDPRGQRYRPCAGSFRAGKARQPAVGLRGRGLFQLARRQGWSGSRSITTIMTGACASRSKSDISKTARSTSSFRACCAKQKNRLGGQIGMHVMERHKMFQIDRPEDIKLCAAIMSSYGYA